MRTVRHVIKSRNTYKELAAKYMGSESKWRDLFLINSAILLNRDAGSIKHVGPDTIFPGDILFVIEDVEIDAQRVS